MLLTAAVVSAELQEFGTTVMVVFITCLGEDSVLSALEQLLCGMAAGLNHIQFGSHGIG